MFECIYVHTIRMTNMQDVQRQACGHAWKELERPPPPPRIGRRAQVLLSGRLCLQCWAGVGLWLASGTRVKSQLTVLWQVQSAVVTGRQQEAPRNLVASGRDKCQ